MPVLYKKMLVPLVAVVAAAAAFAQEGHPLKGSWIGVWEGNDLHGDSVVIVLDWDGERVSGMINPGTQNIEIDSVRLDVDDWSVRIQAGTDGERYVIDGTIQALELPSRSIVGTWRRGDAEGAFEISRQ